jgi:hypothetical protein
MACSFMGYSHTRREDHSMRTRAALEMDCWIDQILSATYYEMMREPENKENYAFCANRAAFYSKKSREALFKLIGDNKDECLSS